MKKQIIKMQVTFNDEKNTAFNSVFTFTLDKSGAFEYGNRSCVVVERQGNNGKAYENKLLDTRYVTMTDFKYFCFAYLLENYQSHRAEVLEHTFGEEF